MICPVATCYEQLRYRIMHRDTLKAMCEQLKKQPLFEACFFNGLEATYALYDDGVEGGANIDGVPLLYRTVNLKTLEIVRSGADRRFWGVDGLCELRAAIEKHYTPEFIQGDALMLAAELFMSIQANRANINHLPGNIIFGQALHYQDVQELTWKDEEGGYVISKNGYLIVHPDGQHESVDVI